MSRSSTKRLLRSAAVAFASAVAATWLPYEILGFFKLELPFSIQASPIAFVTIATIAALLRVIFQLSKDLETVTVLLPHDNDHDDSLLDMIKEAEANSRWGEIVKLGNALSEVLWYTSRKRLRLEIGHFLETAARQLGDNETLARTLIEDLGNTTMGLGDPNRGIQYIKQGIRIAELNNLHYLTARGYRNLANSYSLKGQPAKARTSLQQAKQASSRITEGQPKLEAEGAIEYAESKIHFTDGEYQKAIHSLENTLRIYNQLSQTYPTTSPANADRIVKIYREMGVVWLKCNVPEAQDKAYENCQTGLRLATKTQNYENVVRCCSIMANILLSKGAIPAAEGILSIASKNIAHIDTPTTIDEYTKANRRLINARTIQP